MTEVGIDALKDQLGEQSEPAKRAWDLVVTGVATWSGGKPLGSSRRPRVRGKSASAIVLEDRR
jgi:hypothetical protein